MASFLRTGGELRGAAAAARGGGRASLPTVHRSIPAVSRGLPAERSSAPIAEVLLMAGGLRPRGFRSQLGRSVLDLPVGGGQRLADLWVEEVAKLSEHFGWGHLRARVLIDRGAVAPEPVWSGRPAVEFAVQRDAGEYRGTGGVLRDACRGLAADAYVLVCNACQVLTEPLAQLVERLLACGADVRFPVDARGGAGGVFLVRAGCLSAIPEVGFVDFKEQAIPLIARGHSVRVVELTGECGLPVRSLHDYVQAVRYRVARQQQGGDAGHGFSIIEPGAHVDASARLHDSVVLRGARVAAGAIVAGSVITSAGVVGKGRRVLHSVVSGGRSSWSAWA